MTNRIVKDCRVGRTRPPRNDTKLVGFMKKPTSFLIGVFYGAPESINAALSGSFAPTDRFANLEIQYSCKFQTPIWNKIPR